MRRTILTILGTLVGLVLVIALSFRSSPTVREAIKSAGFDGRARETLAKVEPSSPQPRWELMHQTTPDGVVVYSAARRATASDGTSWVLFLTCGELAATAHSPEGVPKTRISLAVNSDHEISPASGSVVIQFDKTSSETRSVRSTKNGFELATFWNEGAEENDRRIIRSAVSSNRLLVQTDPNAVFELKGLGEAVTQMTVPCQSQFRNAIAAERGSAGVGPAVGSPYEKFAGDPAKPYHHSNLAESEGKPIPMNAHLSYGDVGAVLLGAHLIAEESTVSGQRVLRVAEAWHWDQTSFLFEDGQGLTGVLFEKALGRPSDKAELADLLERVLKTAGKEGWERYHDASLEERWLGYRKTMPVKLGFPDAGSSTDSSVGASMWYVVNGSEETYTSSAYPVPGPHQAVLSILYDKADEWSLPD